MVDDLHEMDVRVVEAPGILDLGVLLTENAWIVIGGALIGAVLAFLLALVLPRTLRARCSKSSRKRKCKNHYHRVI